MDPVVSGEEIEANLGHVHRRGAFGFAGLAGDAEIHHLVHASAGPLGGWQMPRKHRAQGVGSASGAVLLFVGDHEAGTHGAARGLAAGTGPVAHLDGPVQPRVVPEIDLGVGETGTVALPEA